MKPKNVNTYRLCLADRYAEGKHTLGECHELAVNDSGGPMPAKEDPEMKLSDFDKRLNRYLSEGLPPPVAREKALRKAASPTVDIDADDVPRNAGELFTRLLADGGDLEESAVIASRFGQPDPAAPALTPEQEFSAAMARGEDPEAAAIAASAKAPLHIKGRVTLADKVPGDDAPPVDTSRMPPTLEPLAQRRYADSLGLRRRATVADFERVEKSREVTLEALATMYQRRGESLMGSIEHAVRTLRELSGSAPIAPAVLATDDDGPNEAA